ISVATAGILEEIEGLQFKNKKAAAFGSYGWSGESIAKITKSLENSGFEMINNGLKCLWNPDDENIEKCVLFGAEFAKS
ncbi:MAG: anaerobic nitric oxide reductase flavorubredoxin, partial [bacterium]|nr:anaerobic nitric oxide reductase flavorubredoxin [bacterium]